MFAERCFADGQEMTCDLRVRFFKFITGIFEQHFAAFNPSLQYFVLAFFDVIVNSAAELDLSYYSEYLVEFF